MTTGRFMKKDIQVYLHGYLSLTDSHSLHSARSGQGGLLSGDGAECT